MANDMRAVLCSLDAAHHLNEAMLALQHMQGGLEAIGCADLSRDIRDVERDIDAARDVVLGTRRLAQIHLGLIDRETLRPIPATAETRDADHGAAAPTGDGNRE